MFKNSQNDKNNLRKFDEINIKSDYAVYFIASIFLSESKMK